MICPSRPQHAPGSDCIDASNPGWACPSVRFRASGTDGHAHSTSRPEAVPLIERRRLRCPAQSAGTGVELWTVGRPRLPGAWCHVLSADFCADARLLEKNVVLGLGALQATEREAHRFVVRVGREDAVWLRSGDEVAEALGCV